MSSLGDVVRAKGRDPVGLAFELAVSCSATGARPLTRNERFTAAKRLSEIHPEWSLREVAKRTGTSHQTVLRQRGPTGSSGAGPNGPITPSGDNATAARVAARHPTLEQLAYRTAVALGRLLDRAHDESRGLGARLPGRNTTGPRPTACETSCEQWAGRSATTRTDQSCHPEGDRLLRSGTTRSSSRLLTAQLRRKQQSRLHCYVGEKGQSRLATSVWLLASGRDSELVGLLVAALLAEQKTAQSTDELVRFVRSRHAQLHDIRARNRAGSADRAGCELSTLGGREGEAAEVLPI